MALFLFLIIGKTAWLQIVNGEYYYDMANFLLYMIPADLPVDDTLNPIINRISDIIGALSSEDIKREIATIDRGSLEAFLPLFITDNIEYEKAAKNDFNDS